MTKTPASWDLYRSFLAVLAEGSLSGAARRLGLRQPTIGRHVDALEKSLGVALFTRSQEGVKPTDAARELEPYAAGMSRSADALVRAASATAGEIAGSVRISASEVVGAEVLPPILTLLREAHPRLDIELVLSNRLDDVLQREADIAVRMVRPKQGALFARRIGDIAVGLHAHRRYLDRAGTPATLADLGRHTVIGFDHETAFIRSLIDIGMPLRRDSFALRSDSDLAHLACIRAGYGIGGCQVLLARRDRDLVRMLARDFEIKLETWVVMHEDLRASGRCRTAFDALVRGLGAYVRGIAIEAAS